LKILKVKLNEWNFNTFGKVYIQINAPTLKVNFIQEEINRLGHFDCLFEFEKTAKLELENHLNLEEVFW
jgi:hypothetical protein